ncbi:hypothetical protein Dimus_010713 [Dionaea muscipula]
MWSYDSAKHQDHRVRSMVEKSMRECLGLEEVVFRPDLPDLAPIQIPESDLKDSSEGFALTMADALSPSVSEGRGCEEALGPSTVSVASYDGVGLEMEVAELSKLSSVMSDFDGASELTDGVVGGEEPKDRAVGPKILSYPCVPVSAPSPPRAASAEDRGYGALNAGVAETVGAGEYPATLSPMVCSSLSSRSRGPQFLDCADEQRNGLVGVVVAQPISVEIGSGGGADVMQEVEGGMGSDDMMLPTDLVSYNLPCVPSLFSADETASDGGFVREELRVSPKAGGALRPRPTDGLWQPPWSLVEPVSERVEKDKGTHGCASDARKDQGESHLHLRFSLSHFQIWFSLSALARDLFFGRLLRLEMMDSSSGDDIGDADGRFPRLSDSIEIRRMRLSDSSNSNAHVRRTVSDLILSVMLPTHLDSPVVDVVGFSGAVIPHGLVGVGGLDLDGAVPQMVTDMFDSQGRVVGCPGALVLGGQFCPDLGGCETPETVVEVPGSSIPDLGDCSSLVAEELHDRGSLLVDVHDDGQLKTSAGEEF